MSSHYTIVNDNYITVNNIFNDCIINLCGFRFFWDTLYFTDVTTWVDCIKLAVNQLNLNETFFNTSQFTQDVYTYKFSWKFNILVSRFFQRKNIFQGVTSWGF